MSTKQIIIVTGAVTRSKGNKMKDIIRNMNTRTFNWASVNRGKIRFGLSITVLVLEILTTCIGLACGLFLCTLAYTNPTNIDMLWRIILFIGAIQIVFILGQFYFQKTDEFVKSIYMMRSIQ